ncbi:uncharacterized protein [Clytia hemisphaerica]|uniref:G domain-containing protein n=1 Tax=Clytia hemisphaerica TaxID=252671 RepID=A0A7M6DN59_9CNID
MDRQKRQRNDIDEFPYRRPKLDDDQETSWDAQLVTSESKSPEMNERNQSEQNLQFGDIFSAWQQQKSENNGSSVKEVDSDKAPYIVLVGNVGSGKSTIVEKLAGVDGRSSSSASSATRSAEYFLTPDQSLLIADTPGTNPRKDKLEHNNEIAAALSYREVSKFIVVVKASLRMDQTLDDIKQYYDRFNALPEDLVGVLVTHMDLHKEWDEEEILEAIDEDFEITDVVFSDRQKKGFDLCKDVLRTCRKTFVIDMQSDLFSRLFRFKDSNRKILKVTNDFVKRFKSLKKSFEGQRKNFDEADRCHLDCEFWALFKTHLTETAKQDMVNELNFNFERETKDMEEGYLMNMVNQTNAAMNDIQIRIARNQDPYASTKNCPHCGRICENPKAQTCGKPKRIELSTNSPCTMAHFTFKIIDYRKVEIQKKSFGGQFQDNKTGCGQKISWNEMMKVNHQKITQIQNQGPVKQPESNQRPVEQPKSDHHADTKSRQKTKPKNQQPLSTSDTQRINHGRSLPKKNPTKHTHTEPPRYVHQKEEAPNQSSQPNKGGRQRSNNDFNQNNKSAKYHPYDYSEEAPNQSSQPNKGGRQKPNNDSNQNNKSAKYHPYDYPEETLNQFTQPSKGERGISNNDSNQNNKSRKYPPKDYPQETLNQSSQPSKGERGRSNNDSNQNNRSKKYPPKDKPEDDGTVPYPTHTPPKGGYQYQRVREDKPSHTEKLKNPAKGGHKERNRGKTSHSASMQKSTDPNQPGEITQAISSADYKSEPDTTLLLKEPNERSIRHLLKRHFYKSFKSIRYCIPTFFVTVKILQRINEHVFKTCFGDKNREYKKHDHLIPKQPKEQNIEYV